MDNEDLKKMTLRQVMEYTKNIPINQGGLSIFIEKLVTEIEAIDKSIEWIIKDNELKD